MNTATPARLIMQLVKPYFAGEEGEDPPQVNGEEVVGNSSDARMKMLEAIADESEAQRIADGELEEVQDDGSTVVLQPPAQQTDEQKQLEADAAAVAAAKAAEQPQTPPAKIVRKINGVDTEITDAMLAHAMKVAAADVYLEEAKRIRNEAATNQQQASEQDLAAKKAEDRQALLDSVRALQMGTEEEGVDALQKLLSKEQKPPVTVDEAAIARKVDERLAFNQAIERFSQDYQDIVKDPMLWKLACDRDDHLMKQGDKRPFYDRFKETGDQLRLWKTNLTGGSQQAATTGQEAPAGQTKEQRKQAATATAAKAATGRSAGPAQSEDENTEENKSDIIAQMRKARGQNMRN